jgi:cardiolipin synthase A/B
VEMIYAARKSVVITNPYLVPTEAIMEAMTSAALRGVQVTIINSEVMDQWAVGHAQRSYYQQLLTAGVKIYLYKAPILLHSKHMTVDDDIALLGSSNMDIRSFELDLEVTMIAYDKNVVKDLRKVQAHDMARSKQVKLGSWKKRGIQEKFSESVARLTSAVQ